MADLVAAIADFSRGFEFCLIPKADYVALEIERMTLAFAKRSHHLEASDHGIGGLQRFEDTHRTDQQLQLAVIGFDDIIVGQIPEDRDWHIPVDGDSGKAAGSSGVAVGDWEENLLRIGTIVGYLVANGMLTERLAVRFQAGFGGFADTNLDTRVVELKLLCCMATNGASDPASN